MTGLATGLRTRAWRSLPGDAGRAALGRRRPPAGLLALGLLAGLAAALPAIYLVVLLAGSLDTAAETIFDSRTVGLTVRTVGLTVAVTATAVAIGLPLAWLTSRTDLPGRRLWATLTALPLVIPSYIGAYVFVSALGPSGLLADVLGADRIPSIYGFPGAWLVLSLFTYPLVLLSARAALSRLDPALEDAARSMGRSRREVFRTVILPQLIPAIGAGALLVALYVISDFGAVSIMRFDSFTREIYITWQSSFDRTSAAALGLLLVIGVLILLAVYSWIRGSLRYYRTGPGAGRPASIVPLGRWRWPAIGFCSLITLVALVLPVGVLIYWAVQGLGAGIDAGELVGNAWHSLVAGTGAALLAALFAIVIAVLAVRFPSPVTALVERLGYVGYALPGIVVALALVFFGTRVALPLYQTLGMLVFALTIHYLPLAVGSVSSSLLQVPPRFEEAARGMGRGPLEVFRTITTPLVAGGIAAGAALVFLHAVKELPATLLLAPIGFETLATDIWRQTSLGFFEGSAVPSLVLLIVAAPPLWWLTGRGEPRP
ncbi:MAG TPA: iron ABC transporter permease [Solirubrobacterales bacterium]|nr:iron ABC transporter permease [Solirubrobacterales bacterium]